MEVVQVRNLSKNYGALQAVDGVSFAVPEGSVFGMLGPNGAGKTTIIKMLTGLLKPTEGEIYIDGRKMSRNNVEIKKRIGIVPQYTNLDKELTVYENLVFAAKLFRINKKQYSIKIKELLEFMELEEYKNRQVFKLSGGMQRRLMIAKALINEPDIIFLDEPTNGVDLNGRRRIWDIFKVMKTVGKTVIMTTHYIEEADYLCSMVCLINEGKIFKNDTPDNLKREQGRYTIEYFDNQNGQMVTKYRHFKSKEEALNHVPKIKNFHYTVRETTLEDVFYNLTSRKVV